MFLLFQTFCIGIFPLHISGFIPTYCTFFVLLQTSSGMSCLHQLCEKIHEHVYCHVAKYEVFISRLNFHSVISCWENRHYNTSKTNRIKSLFINLALTSHPDTCLRIINVLFLLMNGSEIKRQASITQIFILL